MRSGRSTTTRRRVGVPHSDVGGRHWLVQTRGDGLTRILLALVTTGHHAGFRDCVAESGTDPTETLFAYLTSEPVVRRHAAAVAEGSEEIRLLDAEIARRGIPALAPRLDYAFAIRFAMAALTEADRIDTGRFHGSVPDETRTVGWDVLLARLRAHLDVLDREALSDHREFFVERPLLKGRLQLRRDCEAAATAPPGLFRVTAPVGLGKTLAVMGFALAHAARNGQRRVIWVTPHIAVTAQVAGVFRSVFGSDDVLEHHSGVIDHHRPGTRAYASAKDRMRLILARESWRGPPVIVSTIHQLFESLMAATPSRLRKVGALRDAVIVIDEAQGLPTDVMQQITADLNEIMLNYGASVVLCTATQPPLKTITWKRFSGLRPGTEVVRDPGRLFAATQRVRVRVHDDLQPVAWDRLAKIVLGHDAALVIVNEVGQAHDLHRALLANGASAADTLVLTARLCVLDRMDRLARIRTKIAAGIPVKVVSTSLIEAGVDIDFPTVYRALAGLEQIAQAAGRCNREWTRATGDFVLFASRDVRVGAREAAQSATRAVLDRVRAQGLPLDAMLAPEEFARYFGARDVRSDLDRHGVYRRMSGALSLGALPNLRSAGARARLIADETVSVITPWGGGSAEAALRDALTRPDPDVESRIFGLIQGQTVSLRRPVFKRFADSGLITPALDEAVWVARPDAYDDVYGLFRPAVLV